MLSLPSMPSQFLSNAALCLRISPVRCICFISQILLTCRPTFTRTKVVLLHVFEGNIFLFPFAANEVYHRRRACLLDDCGNLADASWLVHASSGACSYQNDVAWHEWASWKWTFDRCVAVIFISLRLPTI